MKIGFLELLVVFVVALLVIGPDKLPGFAQKLGAALKEFRRASADVTKEVRENVIEPLEDAQKPIREAMEPLEELDREVRENVKGVEREFKNIGKPKPPKSEPTAEAEPAPAAEGVHEANEAPIDSESDAERAEETAEGESA